MEDETMCNTEDNHNYWIVTMKPFSEEERNNKDMKDIISNYQKSLLGKKFGEKRKIFGMGWENKNDPFEGKQVDANKDNIIKYLEALKDKRIGDEQKQVIRALDYYNTPKGYPNGLTQSLKYYENEIKIGDFVLMRLDAEYYIGRISQEAKYKWGIDGNKDKDGNLEPRISWYCEVSDWEVFKTDEDLPSEIISQFFKSNQKAVVPIKNNDRLKKLIKGAYTGIFEKSSISEKDFAPALTPDELEDLVAFYIAKENVGYQLLPSSCKKNKQKYEFDFTSPEGKLITCQVKNQAEINLDDYKGVSGYKKIYLFSGLWTDEKVEELISEHKEPHLKFISPTALYNTLKTERYLKDKLSKYYELD